MGGILWPPSDNLKNGQSSAGLELASLRSPLPPLPSPFVPTLPASHIPLSAFPHLPLPSPRLVSSPLKPPLNLHRLHPLPSPPPTCISLPLASTHPYSFSPHVTFPLFSPLLLLTSFFSSHLPQLSPPFPLSLFLPLLPLLLSPPFVYTHIYPSMHSPCTLY